MSTIFEFPRTHPSKEVKIFLYRPIPVRAISAWLGQRPSIRPYFVGRQRTYIGFSSLNEFHGVVIQRFKIIGRVVLLHPLETEPVDVAAHRRHEVLVLFFRIGVIKS